MSATNCILIAKSNMPSKWTVHSAIINDFHLDSSIISCLDRYYKLHWSPDYLFSELHDGIIEHQSIRYLVIYKNCNPFTLKHTTQIEVSFRKPKAEYNLCGYVIIRIQPEYKSKG